MLTRTPWSIFINKITSTNTSIKKKQKKNTFKTKWKSGKKIKNGRQKKKHTKQAESYFILSKCNITPQKWKKNTNKNGKTSCYMMEKKCYQPSSGSYGAEEQKKKVLCGNELKHLKRFVLAWNSKKKNIKTQTVAGNKNHCRMKW